MFSIADIRHFVKKKTNNFICNIMFSNMTNIAAVKVDTLKNKGKSWSCSVTAVEKDRPALAINHFRTVLTKRADY